jgi:hypothetical protein
MLKPVVKVIAVYLQTIIKIQNAFKRQMTLTNLSIAAIRMDNA